MIALIDRKRRHRQIVNGMKRLRRIHTRVAQITLGHARCDDQAPTIQVSRAGLARRERHDRQCRRIQCRVDNLKGCGQSKLHGQVVTTHLSPYFRRCLPYLGQIALHGRCYEIGQAASPPHATTHRGCLNNEKDTVEPRAETSTPSLLIASVKAVSRSAATPRRRSLRKHSSAAHPVTTSTLVRRTDKREKMACNLGSCSRRQMSTATRSPHFSAIAAAK